MVEQKRTVALSIAGKTYRVVTSASEEEIQRLAAIVDERVRAVSRGRQAGPDAVVLAAIALAYDADEARTRAERLEAGTRTTMKRMLERIDVALAAEQGVEGRQEP